LLQHIQRITLTHGDLLTALSVLNERKY